MVSCILKFVLLILVLTFSDQLAMKWSFSICKAQGFQFSAGFFQSPIEEFRSSKKSVNCELFSLVPLTLRTPVCLAFHILGGHLQQGQLSMTASD